MWIDNPPLNVLSRDTIDRLSADLAAVDEQTHVVVVRGRGERGFSAGADIASFAPGRGPSVELHPLVRLIERMPVPVLAAIHGLCLGGGLEVALGCDIRVAHTDATLAMPETGLGLIPGGGGTQRLPRIVGPGRAAWMVMSGERLDVSRAEAWGLVDVVAGDLDAAVDGLAGAIARRPRGALGQAKRVMLETRDRLDDQVELDAFVACIASADGQEGIAAFLEKRQPRWLA